MAQPGMADGVDTGKCIMRGERPFGKKRKMVHPLAIS